MFFPFSKVRYSKPVEKYKAYLLQSMIQGIFLEDVRFLESSKNLKNDLELRLKKLFGEKWSKLSLSSFYEKEFQACENFILNHKGSWSEDPMVNLERLKPQNLHDEIIKDPEFGKLLRSKS